MSMHEFNWAGARENNDTTAAANVFRDLVRRDPNFAEGHNNLGLVLLQAGEVHRAEAAFEEAIGLNRSYAEAHYNLALALRQEGKKAEPSRNSRRHISSRQR